MEQAGGSQSKTVASWGVLEDDLGMENESVWTTAETC